jgi:hypothetical protein
VLLSGFFTLGVGRLFKVEKLNLLKIAAVFTRSEAKKVTYFGFLTTSQLRGGGISLALRLKESRGNHDSTRNHPHTSHGFSSNFWRCPCPDLCIVLRIIRHSAQGQNKDRIPDRHEAIFWFRWALKYPNLLAYRRLLEFYKA